MKRNDLKLEDVKAEINTRLQSFKEFSQEVQIEMLAKYTVELIDNILEEEQQEVFNNIKNFGLLDFIEPSYRFYGKTFFDRLNKSQQTKPTN